MFFNRQFKPAIKNVAQVFTLLFRDQIGPGQIGLSITAFFVKPIDKRQVVAGLEFGLRVQFDVNRHNLIGGVTTDGQGHQQMPAPRRILRKLPNHRALGSGIDRQSRRLRQKHVRQLG